MKRVHAAAARLLQTASTGFASRIERAEYPPDFDSDTVDVIERVGDRTMTSAERMYGLLRAVEYVIGNKVPGAIVECGVWRGGSMMAVALTLRRLEVTDRELFLFDTFAGMTPPADRDVNFSGAEAAQLLEAEPRTTKSTLWGCATAEEVREGMVSTGYPLDVCDWSRVLSRRRSLARPGPDRAPSARHRLVRLHETRAHHLYPRLSAGGVLIIDDYGHWRGAREAVDEFMSGLQEAPLLCRVDYTCRIAVVCRRS